MKKTLLIMAVSLSLNQMAIAQGFLGKLRDKVAQTGSEGARSNNKLSDTNIKQIGRAHV